MEQFSHFRDNKKEREISMEKLVKEVKDIGSALEKAGFEAYAVGGCVRDLLLGKEPKDWDVTTNATPEETQVVFPDSFYENKFGTVGVKTESENPDLKVIEVTTFRLEGKYTDKRHPDEIKFAKTVEEDLARRDFTVNALALSLVEGMAGKIVDPYGGQEDLEKKVIRAVGNPEERFQEDALRIMRAVRFMSQLGFEIEKDTAEAMKKHAGLLEFISKERIRDEFSKLLMSEKAADGIWKMQELGLLKYVLPELEEGVDVGQNQHHIYTVFEHVVRSLDYAAKNNFSLVLRWAALLHDIGKPRTKDGEGEDSTFYNHQVVGTKMALRALDRLHLPKKDIEIIALLIQEHMFQTDTDKSVRRLLQRVGKENIDDLLLLRQADRIGSGVKKAEPYRLRALQAQIEKVSQDPISVKMLKVSGMDVMQEVNLQPGPKVGQILAILLEEVLDDPSLNVQETLMVRVKDLGQMEDRKLEEMVKFAKKSAEEAQGRIDEAIKGKYFVK